MYMLKHFVDSCEHTLKTTAKESKKNKCLDGVPQKCFFCFEISLNDVDDSL